MDWKMLLIGALMTAGGGYLMYRFRATNFTKEVGPGCIMSVARLLAMTGLIALVLGFIMRV